MNYDKLYYQIIERAIKETRKAIRYKGNGTYYELHHIIPRSFGGSNKANNLVLLTAREHFVVHWILVKRYEKGSAERNKMLFALWRMQTNPADEKRYINARVYEKLRIEFAKAVGKMTSVLQKGKNNSQYGRYWYTNRNTGETKRIKNNTDSVWIKGKNWFKHAKLYSIKTKKPCYTAETYIKINKKVKNHIIDLEKWTKETWNKFHNSDCKSLNDFYKRNMTTVTGASLTNRFKMFIPIFNKLSKQGVTFKPDKNLINVFE